MPRTVMAGVAFAALLVVPLVVASIGARTDAATATTPTLVPPSVAALPADVVSYCHRTNSVINPYNLLTTDADAVIGHGHDGHTGPIFLRSTEGRRQVGRHHPAVRLRRRAGALSGAELARRGRTYSTPAAQSTRRSIRSARIVDNDRRGHAPLSQRRPRQDQRRYLVPSTSTSTTTPAGAVTTTSAPSPSSTTTTKPGQSSTTSSAGSPRPPPLWPPVRAVRLRPQLRRPTAHRCPLLRRHRLDPPPVEALAPGEVLSEPPLQGRVRCRPGGSVLVRLGVLSEDQVRAVFKGK